MPDMTATSVPNRARYECNTFSKLCPIWVQRLYHFVRFKSATLVPFCSIYDCNACHRLIHLWVQRPKMSSYDILEPFYTLMSATLVIDWYTYECNGKKWTLMTKEMKLKISFSSWYTYECNALKCCIRNFYNGIDKFVPLNICQKWSQNGTLMSATLWNTV